MATGGARTTLPSVGDDHSPGVEPEEVVEYLSTKRKLTEDLSHPEEKQYRDTIVKRYKQCKDFAEVIRRRSALKANYTKRSNAVNLADPSDEILKKWNKLDLAFIQLNSFHQLYVHERYGEGGPKSPEQSKDKHYLDRIKVHWRKATDELFALKIPEAEAARLLRQAKIDRDKKSLQILGQKEEEARLRKEREKRKKREEEERKNDKLQREHDANVKKASFGETEQSFDPNLLQIRPPIHTVITEEDETSPTGSATFLEEGGAGAGKGRQTSPDYFTDSDLERYHDGMADTLERRQERPQRRDRQGLPPVMTQYGILPPDGPTPNLTPEHVGILSPNTREQLARASSTLGSLTLDENNRAQMSTGGGEGRLQGYNRNDSQGVDVRPLSRQFAGSGMTLLAGNLANVLLAARRDRNPDFQQNSRLDTTSDANAQMGRTQGARARTSQPTGSQYVNRGTSDVLRTWPPQAGGRQPANGQRREPVNPARAQIDPRLGKRSNLNPDSEWAGAQTEEERENLVPMPGVRGTAREEFLFEEEPRPEKLPPRRREEREDIPENNNPTHETDNRQNAETQNAETRYQFYEHVRGYPRNDDDQHESRSYHPRNEDAENTRQNAQFHGNPDNSGNPRNNDDRGEAPFQGFPRDGNRRPPNPDPARNPYFNWQDPFEEDSPENNAFQQQWRNADGGQTRSDFFPIYEMFGREFDRNILASQFDIKKRFNESYNGKGRWLDFKLKLKMADRDMNSAGMEFGQRLLELKKILTPGSVPYKYISELECMDTNYPLAFAILESICGDTKLTIRKDIESLLGIKPSDGSIKDRYRIHSSFVRTEQHLSALQLTESDTILAFKMAVLEKSLDKRWTNDIVKWMEYNRDVHHPLGFNITFKGAMDRLQMSILHQERVQEQHREDEPKFRKVRASSAKTVSSPKGSMKKPPSKIKQSPKASVTFQARKPVPSGNKRTPSEGRQVRPKPRQSETKENKGKSSNCPFCNDRFKHAFPLNCSRLKGPDRLTEEKVRDMIKKFSLCHNCARRGHSSNNCDAPQVQCCPKCKKRHCIYLHGINKPQGQGRDGGQQDKKPGFKPRANLVTALFSKTSITHREHRIMPTLMCYIVAENGQKSKIRLLLDTACEITLIRRQVAAGLGLRGKKTKLQLALAGDNLSEITQEEEVNFQLQSLDGKFKSRKLTGTTSKEVSSAVRAITFKPDRFDHLKGIEFTERYPNTADLPIDILLDTSLVAEFQNGAAIKSKNKDVIAPTAQPTDFGWVLTGRFKIDPSEKKYSDRPMMLFSKPQEVEEKMPFRSGPILESRGIGH